MPENSKVNIEDQDNSDLITGSGLGVVGFEGITRRGPVNRPDILISTLTQWRKLYGGIITTSDFPLQVERVLKAGINLRINGIRHYTTISDKTTLTALPATAAAVPDPVGPTPLFTGVSKYPGADYNNMLQNILPASNGKANYFDLQIVITGDEANATELYPNIIITGHPNIANSHYLDIVNQQSNLVVYTYSDLSAASGQLRPANASHAFSGGSNGGAIVQSDYIGDQGAKTGLFSFDAFDDLSDIAIPVISDSTVNDALANYADGRKDLQSLIHIGNTNITSSTIITARGTTDTKYSAWYAGGVVIPDPVTNLPTPISEIADMVIVNNFVDTKYFPWISRAGTVKGIIKNASGVVNNFGAPGSISDLSLLAQNQVNMVINAGGKVYLKGNFTGQTELSKASYFGIVRGLIFVKKSLKPVLERYLEEPGDIPTFLKLYKEVEPFMDSLTTNRFLYKGVGSSGTNGGYDWNGDQYATSINNMQYNTKQDLDLGIYNIQLILYPINSIQEINLGIVLNSLTGVVSFSL